MVEEIKIAVITYLQLKGVWGMFYEEVEKIVSIFNISEEEAIGIIRECVVNKKIDVKSHILDSWANRQKTDTPFLNMSSTLKPTIGYNNDCYTYHLPSCKTI